MNAKQLLDEGRLGPAIDQLGQEVKAQPSDPRLRTSLFELLCFAGDWDLRRPATRRPGRLLRRPPRSSVWTSTAGCSRPSGSGPRPSIGASGPA